MVFMQLFNFTNLHHYHPIVLLLLHKHMPGTTFYRILGANFEYLIQSIVMPQVCLELRFRHLNSFLNNKKLVFVNFHMKIRAFVYSRCKKMYIAKMHIHIVYPICMRFSSSPGSLLGNFWESAKVKAASRLECVAA